MEAPFTITNVSEHTASEMTAGSGLMRFVKKSTCPKDCKAHAERPPIGIEYILMDETIGTASSIKALVWADTEEEADRLAKADIRAQMYQKLSKLRVQEARIELLLESIT